MERKKKEALLAAGWKIGTVQGFLDLSDEETAFVEMKVALSLALKKERQKRKLTQAQLAKMVGSTQPRVAKMERGETTIDMLVRSLLAMGASPKLIGRKIGTAA